MNVVDLVMQEQRNIEVLARIVGDVEADRITVEALRFRIETLREAVHRQTLRLQDAIVERSKRKLSRPDKSVIGKSPESRTSAEMRKDQVVTS